MCSLGLCKLIVLTASEQYAPPADELVAAARAYVQEIKTRHPTLDFELPEPKKAQAACFPLDTLILIASGAWERVGDLRPGDRVLDVDVRTGCWQPAPVVRIQRHARVRIVDLVLEDGTEVCTTAHHSFMTRRGWLAVSKMRAGDACLVAGQDRSLSFQAISAVRLTSRVETVVNVITAGEHTSCVGGLVAHQFTTFRTVRCLLSRWLEPVAAWFAPGGHHSTGRG